MQFWKKNGKKRKGNIPFLFELVAYGTLTVQLLPWCCKYGLFYWVWVEKVRNIGQGNFLTGNTAGVIYADGYLLLTTAPPTSSAKVTRHIPAVHSVPSLTLLSSVFNFSEPVQEVSSARLHSPHLLFAWGCCLVLVFNERDYENAPSCVPFFYPPPLKLW